ncbi:MAG TPA: TetR family transcriptional regulator [Rhizomicrobium sp.]|nr:TetR family transcriptional regulator [Rhizomicrobium sp.]
MGAGREAPQSENSGGVVTAIAEISPEARTEILKAARDIIAREGVETFTLSAVAREANVPRTSVYALFQNTNELLVALAADDLSNAHRGMNGEVSSEPPPPPLSHADVAATLIDKAGNPGRPRMAADTIVPSSPGTPGEARLPDPEEEGIALIRAGDASEPMPTVARKRGEAAQLNDIINRLTMPGSALGESSAQAVSRIDRRMSLLERALAELEDRFDKFAKGANDSIHATEASLEGLVQRADRTDQRISDTAATLRGEMLSAFTRTQPANAEPPKVVAPPVVQDEDISVSEMSPAEINGSEADARANLRSQSNPQTNGDRNAQGKHFAGEAQSEAAKQALPPPPKRRRKRKYFFSRKELLGIGAISGAVILATMGIAASEGFIDVKQGHFGAPPLRLEQPQVNPAPAPARHAAVADRPAPKPVKVATAEPVREIAPPAAKLSPIERLEVLANGGNAKAAVLLGVKYLDGDGLARNDATAAQWLERAAKAGEPVAQYRLGTLYQRGVGVVQDETQALHWYEAAANQGNRKAMHNLGVFYAEGRGATQDYDKAASWFARAANMGYVDSQFDLAVLYERGAGVPQSLGDAYKWYAIAAHNGDEVSKARIDVLETQLDPGELAAAKAAVRAFRPQALSRAANMTPRMADLAVK